ncbi:MAG: class I adenylate-forming enzyme family protein [Acidimicrobiia bacterium]
MAGIPFGKRLTNLAERLGDATAVVFAAADGSEEVVSWRRLDERANQVARLLAERGIAEGDLLAVGLPNSLEHLYATFGAWKLGASALPLRADLPAWERDRLLAVADPKLVVSRATDLPAPSLTPDEIRASVALDGSPLPTYGVPPTTRLIATSGSTGTPKVIVGTSPGLFVEDEAGMTNAVTGGAVGVTYLVVSPLYHNNGFMFTYPMLLAENRVVLVERFDAAQAVDLIERHRVQHTVMVPTMLQRIARLDGVRDRDFSSLERVIYGGATLPDWVARTWLELVPPANFLFVYGGSEQMGGTMCTGVEWLDRPGTCGLPINCEVQILDADRTPMPTGDIGEVFMRLPDPAQPFRYVGTETPEPILDGFRSYGDMGYLDADGYLYIVDRRQDMIVSGGANIFPAEVEAALSEHTGLADAVVIGLPDPEWGHRVHAIVQPADGAAAPSDDELRAHCRARLAPYKVPKAFEVVEAVPRTSAGKVNRSRLVSERVEAPA